MNLHQIEFEETGRFSSIFLDYINNKESLRQFFNLLPEIDNFRTDAAKRDFDAGKRKILMKALEEQYSGIETTSTVTENIGALAKNNTFTITTGHQLNIFTGPLYFIYKIIAAINLAKELKRQNPHDHFVPVYWMASEDHDFDEICHFRLFGNKYVWENNEAGPVGKLKTSSMQSLLESIPDLPEFVSKSYLQSKNLAEATTRIVNDLFGQYGLVIVDADHPELKSLFASVIKDDIINQPVQQLVENATLQLENAGYKGQIFPREINFFYMENGLRERIVKEEGVYKVLNTSLTFTESELTRLVDGSPEKFSPNVVMRPLYQETILPNLAYIGGPAEMAYWLQLRFVFTHYGVPFPILVPRLFAMVIPRAVTKKMDKTRLGILDLFCDMATLKERIINAGGEKQIDLSDELDELQKLFNSIKEKAGQADKSLEGFVLSEQKKVEKSIDHIQKRIKKAEEQRHEVSINQVRGIMEKLFPNDNLQEREDNFLNFYINNPAFIDELIQKLDPLSLKFNILTEDA
jgi:bacillithiol biosynthesis cysteine-adding enzyme BshC